MITIDLEHKVWELAWFNLVFSSELIIKGGQQYLEVAEVLLGVRLPVLLLGQCEQLVLILVKELICKHFNMIKFCLLSWFLDSSEVG